MIFYLYRRFPCKCRFALYRPGNPNVILILGDDVGYEIPTYTGGESYSTPNIDRLQAWVCNFQNAMARHYVLLRVFHCLQENIISEITLILRGEVWIFLNEQLLICCRAPVMLPVRWQMAVKRRRFCN